MQPNCHELQKTLVGAQSCTARNWRQNVSAEPSSLDKTFLGVEPGSHLLATQSRSEENIKHIGHLLLTPS